MIACPKIDFARAEGYSGAELLHGVIQGQLNGTVVLDDAHLRPRRSLATDHTLVHKFSGRVREHAREICVGYLWEDVNVT